jgi:hypothetical protein
METFSTYLETYNLEQDANNLEWWLFLLSKINIYEILRNFYKVLVFNNKESPKAHPYYVFSRPPSQISMGVGRDYDEFNILVTDHPLSFDQLQKYQVIPIKKEDILDISQKLFKAGLEIENNSKMYLITKSTHKQGIVRVTEFDRGNPTGHIHLDDRQWFVDDMMAKLVGGKVFNN